MWSVYDVRAAFFTSLFPGLAAQSLTSLHLHQLLSELHVLLPTSTTVKRKRVFSVLQWGIHAAALLKLRGAPLNYYGRAAPSELLVYTQRENDTEVKTFSSAEV